MVAFTHLTAFIFDERIDPLDRSLNGFALHLRLVLSEKPQVSIGFFVTKRLDSLLFPDDPIA